MGSESAARTEAASESQGPGARRPEPRGASGERSKKPRGAPVWEWAKWRGTASNQPMGIGGEPGQSKPLGSSEAQMLDFWSEGSNNNANGSLCWTTSSRWRDDAIACTRYDRGCATSKTLVILECGLVGSRIPSEPPGKILDFLTEIKTTSKLVSCSWRAIHVKMGFSQNRSPLPRFSENTTWSLRSQGKLLPALGPRNHLTSGRS